MVKRKSTGKRKRFTIFQRDRFTCQYCGKTPPEAVLVVDHIIPVAGGGGDGDENLITACETCNQGKADKLLTDIPRPIEETLLEQVTRREQLEEYNKWLIRHRKRTQEQVRELGMYWCDSIYPPADKGKWMPSRDRLNSIGQFLKRLPITSVYEAIDIAIGRWTPHPRSDDRAWKYFCGVCWTMIRQREEGTNGAS